MPTLRIRDINTTRRLGDDYGGADVLHHLEPVIIDGVCSKALGFLGLRSVY